MFGIGAGWHEEEFKGYFGRFPPTVERLTGLEEAVEICKSMFTNERTTYHGKIFNVENALNSPQPVQEHLPILIGGGGEKRTLRIAAEHGDISHFFANDLETLERKLNALKRHCKSCGRDYEEIIKGVGIALVVGLDHEEVEARLRRLSALMGIGVEDLRKQLGGACGIPEAIAEFLETYIAKGVGLLTPRFFYIDTMELFAEEVIPLIA